MKKLNKKKGFTLVELIVVIAIIIILAALAVPRVTKYIDDAREARVAGDMRSMYTSVTAAITDYQKEEGADLGKDATYDLSEGKVDDKSTEVIDKIATNLDESKPASIKIVKSGSEDKNSFSVVVVTDAKSNIKSITIANKTHQSVDGATPVEKTTATE